MECSNEPEYDFREMERLNQIESSEEAFNSYKRENDE